MKKEFLSLNMDAELKKKLERIATEQHRSLNQQCILFLSHAVSQCEAKQACKDAAKTERAA